MPTVDHEVNTLYRVVLLIKNNNTVSVKIFNGLFNTLSKCIETTHGPIGKARLERD